jgi:co-chaperonin GroES (HSP10)
MNYKPLRDNVLVIDTEKPEETDSGIYLGKAKSDNSTKTATVLAVGPDVTEVKVDDVVYIVWSNAKVVKDGDQYLGVISENDILAVAE